MTKRCAYQQMSLVQDEFGDISFLDKGTARTLLAVQFKLAGININAYM